MNFITLNSAAFQFQITQICTWPVVTLSRLLLQLVFHEPWAPCESSLMCEFLDNYNFDSVDDDALDVLVDSVINFLAKTRDYFARAAHNLSVSANSNYEDSIHSIVEYREDFLEAKIYEKIDKELPHLPYLRTGSKSPDVCLYGDEPYVYSNSTKNLEPIPITDSLGIQDVLDWVNWYFGTNFNSVLVNRYGNKNVFIDWHQDNEHNVDQSQPVMTLSVGAIRRFRVSDSKLKETRTQDYTKELKSNSMFVMKPGVQESHYHKLETGRGNKRGECGKRYSLTFRRLIPSKKVSPQPSIINCEQGDEENEEEIEDGDEQGEKEEKEYREDNLIKDDKDNLPKADTNTVNHDNCYTTLVFGSSLTKGLKQDILSKRGKNFKVFSHPGAHVKNIISDVQSTAEENEICRDCVESVFVVCGGNDIANMRRDGRISKIVGSFASLIECIKYSYPNSSVNVVSLIPRQLRYFNHLSNMIMLNNKLADLCKCYGKCRFINVFSHFIFNKKDFFNMRNDIILNTRLYSLDEIHFSSIGNSVLAKVIIGVTYSPRPL